MDQETQGVTVPESAREETRRYLIGGVEGPQTALVGRLRERVNESLTQDDPQRAIQGLKEGRMVLASEAIKESVEGRIQDIEEGDSGRVRIEKDLCRLRSEKKGVIQQNGKMKYEIDMVLKMRSGKQ